MEAFGLNGHLVVELIKEEEPEQSSRVLLPDDFEEPRSEYTFAKLKNPAGERREQDSLRISSTDIIVFPTSVLQEVTFSDEVYYLVKENFIVCRLQGE